jgi:hypothetical protein
MAGATPCRLDPQPAQSLCARLDAPDYLVLTARLDGIPAKEWRLPTRVGRGWQALYLYSCRDVTGNKKAGSRPALS